MGQSILFFIIRIDKMMLMSRGMYLLVDTWWELLSLNFSIVLIYVRWRTFFCVKICLTWKWSSAHPGCREVLMQYANLSLSSQHPFKISSDFRWWNIWGLEKCWVHSLFLMFCLLLFENEQNAKLSHDILQQLSYCLSWTRHYSLCFMFYTGGKPLKNILIDLWQWYP